MGIETVGAGIKTRLQTISDLRVFAPNELPGSVNQFPAALILPVVTEYQTTFSTTDGDYNFRIILLLTNQDNPKALDRMLPYMESTGTKSITTAINADSTLGGTAACCRVDRNLGFGSTMWGGSLYLSTEFEMRVWA